MHGIAGQLLHWLVHLGALGLFVLGILDSSFLFLPLGNDLLLFFLASSQRQLIPFFVFCAAAGSTAGVFLLDSVARKGGEDVVKRLANPKRFERVQAKMKQRAALAIITATLAPPPFPFTPMIAAASLSQYPRPKLLGLVFVGRMLRFTVVTLLALKFGPDFLRLLQKPVVQYSIWAFIAFCVVGSGLSIYRWIRGSRTSGSHPGGTRPAPQVT